MPRQSRGRKKTPSPAEEPSRGSGGVFALVARRVLEIEEWDRQTPTDLKLLVSADPYLASRALAAANLPLYGLSRRIATVSHAIAVLGPGAVRRLAVSSARDAALPSRGAAREFSRRLAASALAIRLAEAARYDLPEEAGVAALVAGLDASLLRAHLPALLLEALSAAQSSGATGETSDRARELTALVALARSIADGASIEKALASADPRRMESLSTESAAGAARDAAERLAGVARWLGAEVEASAGIPGFSSAIESAAAAAKTRARTAPSVNGLDRAAPDIAFLHRTIRRLRAVEDGDLLLEAVLSAAHGSLDFDRFVLFEKEKRGKTLLCRKMFDDGEAAPKPVSLKLPHAQRGASLDAVLKDGAARIVSRSDPSDAFVLDLFGCDEVGIVPLVVGGRSAAAIVVDRFYRGGAIPKDSFAALEILCAEAGLVLENRTLSQASRKLKRFAEKDELTGINNRRYCVELCRKEVERARRYRTPLSLVMFDIDNFKELNDRFGHGAGDAVLREVARLIERNTRRSDVIGRYGGDEFLVCLPAIPADQALVYAERMRTEVQKLDVKAAEDAPPVRLAISLGVGSLDVDAEGLDELIAKVDKALYAAKDRGRNRVCVG